jgi:hypothetical protein
MGFEWKRNAQFAEKPILRSIAKRNIAVTLAPKKPTRQNEASQTLLKIMVLDVADSVLCQELIPELNF